MKKLLVGGISALAVLAASGADAREAAAGADTGTPAVGNIQANNEARGSNVLDEIIVTAQRRTENLQDAAIAISVVDSDQLVRAGVGDTTQLTQVAPALQVGTVAGSANIFYLRGVGNFTTNSLADAAVSFNVDGVPYARSQAAHGVFYDLERVEVLKGPQGILYGRNSTGGAINVITAKPRIGESSGFGQGEYGNYGAYRATAAINLPLGQSAALRLSGNLAEHDGYYSDGTGDDESKAVRAQIAGEIGDSINLLVGADYADQGGTGPGSTLVGLDRERRIGVFDPRADAVIANTYAFVAGNFLHPLPDDEFPSFRDNEFWGVYAQADIETPIGTVTVLPAYRKTDLNERSYAIASAVTVQMDSEQTSFEVRLASDNDGVTEYIFGAFYLDEDTDEFPIYNYQYFVGGGLLGSDTKSYAAFGQLTFNVSERLRLTAGARYTVDDKTGFIDVANMSVVCPASFTGGACLGTPGIREDQFPNIGYTPDGQVIPVQPWGSSGAILVNTENVLTPAKKFKKPTYRAGIEFDTAENSLLYATFETGFKAGGFFATIDDPVFEPETIKSFTVGSKNTLADNRIQLNAEVFYWIYEEQQVFHLSNNRLGGVEFVTSNVGKTDIWGVELDTRFRVAEGTTLSGTAQYLNAEYKDFVYFQPAATGVPVSGCDIAGPAAGSFAVDCSGRRPPNAPEWTLSAGVEHIIPTDSGEFVVNLDARYQSGISTGFEQLPSQDQKGYAIANAQVRYEFADPNLSIAAFVNNLFDEEAAAFSFPHGQAGGTLFAESLRPPRTYGVRIGAKF